MVKKIITGLSNLANSTTIFAMHVYSSGKMLFMLRLEFSFHINEMMGKWQFTSTVVLLYNALEREREKIRVKNAIAR